MQYNWLNHYNFLTFEELDSTNSESLRLASAGATGDFVILSRIQTGGRGTKGRHWVSLPGNLHVSILLNTHFDIKRNTQLSFVAANAVYDTISFLLQEQNNLPELNIALKWPNDVLINQQKVAGILLESISFADRNYVVIGFGINAIKAPPNHDGWNATSLHDQGITLDCSDLLLNILINKFDLLYRRWIKEDSFVEMRNTWLDRAFNLGQVITMDDGVRRISGVFKDINHNGAMRLQLASGQICDISMGEMLINSKIESYK